MQSEKDKKFIIVTGGVLSGLGKGVAAAGIGHLFSDDYTVSPIKLDGYLNSDPGTMNPMEHGEVFVLEDGTEVDMDFGHYERFLGQNAKGSQSITMGKIFEEIREKERNGDFLGKTVQYIPHVTNHIQNKIEHVAEESDSDIIIVEVGGTVGDLENELFIEALRQLSSRVGEENICYIHLTFVPIPYGTREQKTKPTQQSVSLLQKKGIWPNIILARSPQELAENSKEKIAMFSNIDYEDVFSAPDLPSIYRIPLSFEKQNLIERVSLQLNLPIPSMNKLKTWNKLLESKPEHEITITIAGKYTELEDSYASIIESITHSSYHLNTKVNIDWLDTSQEIDYEKLRNTDGLIIPGGFGKRGIEGKIEVIKYVRENNIPSLGICYGLQLAVIEYMRNVCGYTDATSLEVDEDKENAAITMLDEQKNIDKIGGTMRLGKFRAKLYNGIIKELYEKFSLNETSSDDFIISERHRHRYEVNPEISKELEHNCMKISGRSMDRDLVEFVELPPEKHKYFVATQAHPELKSKLETPAPLFYGLIENCLR